MAEGALPQEELRRAGTRGFVWTFGQATISRALSLIGFVVLARLLSPSDYGLVALANVFAALLALFAAGGLTQAIIQRPEVDDLDLESTFWAGMLLGIALGLLLVALSWPLASVFGQPGLGPVLRVMAVSLPFIAMGGTPQAVMSRQLRFNTIAQCTVVANLVATVVGVAAAFAGAGVWALVVQVVLAIAFNAVTMLAVCGWLPGPHLSWTRAWSFFDYSRHIVGTNFMNFFTLRADDFLIGGFVGSVALGIYSVAYRILTIVNEVLNLTARQVAYPIFSKVQADLPRLNRAYTSLSRMSALGSVPVFVILIVSAPEIIPLAFGDKWERSVPVMQILCLVGPLYALMQFNAVALQAVGQARLVFRIMTLNTVAQVAAFAVALPFGLKWIAASLVIRAYVLAPLAFRAGARAMNASTRQHMLALGSPLACSVIMAVGAVVAREALAGSLSPLPLLMATVAAALVTYAVALRLLAFDVVREARSYVAELRGGTPTPAPAT